MPNLRYSNCDRRSKKPHVPGSSIDCRHPVIPISDSANGNRSHRTIKFTLEMNMLEVGLIYHLPFSDRLVVNRREAASMLGLSTGHFDKLVRQGVLPSPLKLPGVKRWDKREILRALDAMSERSESRGEEDDLDRELAAFEAKHGYN